jgi:D-alanine--poly(phosphoribitol) ligase subunit 1
MRISAQETGITNQDRHFSYMNYNIAQPFFESARKNPQRLALFASGKSYTYGEMLDAVVRVADWLSSGDQHGPKRVGILGSRSMEACVGILAAAWVGAAYVPINLKLPQMGIVGLLKRSGLDALIADPAGTQMLTPQVLAQSPPKILCVRKHVAGSFAQRAAYFEDLPNAAKSHEPVTTGEDVVAYILYTSGSTGVPKGVMLPNRAVRQLLDVMTQDYPLTPEDRMAETTETSFDLSVYNMFATWRAGASLHIVPQEQAMAPAKFVVERQITAWLSVPSIAAFMSRMGLLKKDVFPSLKYTFFAGEPLLASVAEAWSIAAPNSRVVNMYGPTEAAVICIGQTYGPLSVLTRDCVAIGRPFAQTRAAIAKGETGFASAGTQGELLLAGPQLALGYLDDQDKTAARFATIDGTCWYKTGDLAFYDENGIFHYLGRIDNQVKVLGYRVELEEIECHLRDSTGCVDVAAVAWPLHGTSASGVVAFIVNFAGSEESVKKRLQEALPAYMVPSKIHLVRELPLNNNGKVDRGALLKMLEQETLPE